MAIGERLTTLLETWVSGTKALPVSNEGLLAIRADLEEAARSAADSANVGGGGPLRLTKTRIRQMFDCERHMVAMLDSVPQLPSEELVVGSLLDALTSHRVTTGRLDPEPLALAIALITANNDHSTARILDWVLTLDDRKRAALNADLAEGRERLLSAWPRLEPDWWPRVQERALLLLADGEVMIDSRADIVLGGPPTPRRAAIIETTSRQFRRDDLDDSLLYALVSSLRDGQAPACVITCCGRDEAVHDIWISEDDLRSATTRLQDALKIAGEIAGGRRPAERRGPRCGWCPDLPVCPTGRDARSPEVPLGDRHVEWDDDEPF